MFAIISRVISNTGSESSIAGLKLINFGAHCNTYCCPYLTAAASVGMTQSDVDTFVSRLDKVLTRFKSSKSVKGEGQTERAINNQEKSVNHAPQASSTTDESVIYDKPV